MQRRVREAPAGKRVFWPYYHARVQEKAGTSCSDVRQKAEPKVTDIDQKIGDLRRGRGQKVAGKKFRACRCYLHPGIM